MDSIGESRFIYFLNISRQGCKITRVINQKNVFTLKTKTQK